MSLLAANAAPLTVRGVLVIELVMGGALLVGGSLARRHRYRAHAWCQAAVVLLNLPLTALFMVPSFACSIAPGFVAHPSRSYYWLAAAHGILGAGAELLGLYILLAAGTRLVPQRFRLTNYRFWMRFLLVLWWLALLLGLATYLRWYGGHLL